MFKLVKSRGFASVFLLAVIAAITLFGADAALAQGVEAPATSALADIATAGGLIATAMVAAAASLLVGRWVVAFIT